MSTGRGRLLTTSSSSAPTAPTMGGLGQYVKRVGLVRKLRETRVLVGFSRLMPQTDRGDPSVQTLKVADEIDWLPASRFAARASSSSCARTRSTIGSRTECRQEKDPSSCRRLQPQARGARAIVPPRRRTFRHDPYTRPRTDQGADVHLRIRFLIPSRTTLLQPGGHDRPMNGFLIYTASGRL